MTIIHDDEFDITPSLVKQLITEQCPEWAHESISPIEPCGTDNRMFFLGADKVVRLPRSKEKEPALCFELKWLPHIVDSLTINTPAILVEGQATLQFPCRWYIGNRLDGELLSETNPLDLPKAAEQLARCILELRTVETSGAPQSYRGIPLITKAELTFNAISQLTHLFDENHMTEVWTKALNTEPWQGPPQWLHADLHPGNILVKNHEISAILDFGLAGIGDPTCDLMAAWTILDKSSRPIFKELVDADEQTWLRAKGWAFCFAAVAYPYYEHTLPSLANIAKTTLENILED